jgi:D-sedoheptulose 7-phosphate isomerase
MNHLEQLFQRYPALKTCEGELNSAFDLLSDAFSAGNKLLVCGNGGSAADSEHIVGELMKGFMKPRRIPVADTERLGETNAEIGPLIGRRLQGALPAISLVSQLSLNTAVANDTDGDMVFAQQVYGLGKAGDVLLAITTSGNSQNVINAVVVAQAFGLKTIALTGRSGGKLAPMVNTAVRVPADNVPIIQELHLPVYHWLCIALEEKFFPAS